MRFRLCIGSVEVTCASIAGRLQCLGHFYPLSKTDAECVAALIRDRIGFSLAARDDLTLVGDVSILGELFQDRINCPFARRTSSHLTSLNFLVDIVVVQRPALAHAQDEELL